MRPDLILMDIYIKGEINGIETASYMRNLYNIPSVFVTAYHDEATFSDIVKTKPVGVLSKPFNQTEFTKIMSTFKTDSSPLF